MVAAITLIAAMVWISGINTIAEVAASIGWTGFGWLFLFYFATQGCRAARLWVAIRADSRPSFGRLFCIASIHQLLNHLLPARLGEVGFPLLLKRFTSVPAVSAVSLLVFVRLQEIFVLALIFGFAALTLAADNVGSSATRVELLGIVVMAIVVALQALLRPILRFVARVVRPSQVSGFRTTALRARVGSFLSQLEGELAVRLTIARQVLFFALTVLVWLSMFSFFREVLRMGGIKLTFGETILGSALANLSHILPVNAVGSFGSLEAGWTVGFSFIGIDPKIALASGLVMHVLVLIYLVLLAAPAWLWLMLRGCHEISV